MSTRSEVAMAVNANIIDFYKNYYLDYGGCAPNKIPHPQISNDSTKMWSGELFTEPSGPKKSTKF